MFWFVTAGSTAAIVLLVICLLLVLAFEFSNGFHDTANAVATVIYTNSLKPVPAVVLSGVMNFLGVLTGGIAVAYAVVHILPPEVLSPPDTNPAIGMLAALLVSAFGWNIATWALGIPNSSSHALIGSLIGISIASSLHTHVPLNNGVDWSQIVKVLEALLFSPLIGFVCALILFNVVKLLFKDRALYQQPEGETPPVWWVRALLILTCTGVSYSHGSNDGQKSIGLIMLVVIGLAPFSFAIDLDRKPADVAALAPAAHEAAALIQSYGGYDKARGLKAATDLEARLAGVTSMHDIARPDRPHVRGDVTRVQAALQTITEDRGTTAPDAVKKQAKALGGTLGKTIEYAPWWVRILSALCLGIGTMVGYRRIVVTLGEKLGKSHLVPAQGASAELVSAVVIGVAGFTGGPVSTTHVVTSGIAGTMVGSGAGLRWTTIRKIMLAWILTLPGTIIIAGGLYYLFTL
ncbi:inorganic phosphate transporter [Novosphingobium sp. 9]|uniref:inorganic phosphate transporter n=1 Tax=Novosphingobium sp. 9 TaxID=2025349 RepID=UPI0021B5CC92|nr:inorganic phosphate transporter [Novosphingobium sp. 9]